MHDQKSLEVSDVQWMCEIQKTKKTKLRKLKKIGNFMGILKQL